MNKEFFESLELLEKEKGIPKEEMMEKVENALLAAFRTPVDFVDVSALAPLVKACGVPYREAGK